MLKVLHTADLHLNKRLSYLPDQRMEEIWDSLEKMLAYGEENAQLMIIAGDLFEFENFNLEDGRRLAQLFSYYPSLPIVFNNGNHDPLIDSSPIWSLNFSDNVFFFKSDEMEQVELGGLHTRIYGNTWLRESYPQARELNLKVDQDYINILVLHSEVIAPRNDYMYYDWRQLLSLGFDYVALGHVHKHQVLGDRIVYPGCPEPQKFTDTGSKGFVMAQVSKSSPIIEFLPWSKREYRTEIIDIEAEDDLESIEDRILAYRNPNDIYKFSLQGQLGFSSRDLELSLRALESDFYYVEFEDKTKSTDDYEIDRLDPFLRNFVLALEESGADPALMSRARDKGLRLLLGDGNED